MYWLFRLVQDKKNVIYECGPRESRECYLWTSELLLCNKASNDPSIPFSSYLEKSDTLQLVDSRRDPDYSDACQTIVFTSPREENLHDLWKRGAHMFYMPLWSASELEYCRERNYDGLPEACMSAAIDVLGTVPRFVLDLAAKEVATGRWSVEAALRGEVSHVMLRKITYPLSGMSESSMRELLILSRLEVGESANPGSTRRLVHVDVEFQNYEEPIYIFASPYVCEALLSRFSNIIDARVRELIAAGESFFELATFHGFMFERFTHRSLTSGLGNVEARVLADDSVCPRREILPFTASNIGRTVVFSKIEDMDRLEANTYYRPKSQNHPSIDSFRIVNRTLYLIQATIAAQHPIKIVQVRKLVEKANCGRTFLVFMTVKKQVDSFHRQKFATTKGEPVKRLSKRLEDVTQIVIGVDI